MEGTASDVLRIFVDREAEWEQMQEELGQDEVDEALPLYCPPTPEGVVQALNLLAGRLELRAMFQSMPTEDLRWDLRQLVQIQRAIVHVLRLVEGTASDVLRIFVDREAEWEQMQEELGQDEVDEVVDTTHGTDDGEDFDYDGNLDS